MGKLMPGLEFADWLRQCKIEIEIKNDNQASEAQKHYKRQYRAWVMGGCKENFHVTRYLPKISRKVEGHTQFLQRLNRKFPRYFAKRR